MTRRQKTTLIRILCAFALFAAALFIPAGGWLRAVLFLIPYAVVGWDILWRAVRNIARGQVFDENFLMSLATVGAFAVGEYPEGVAVMLFYQVGELFQSYAVGRSRREIAALMDIRPDTATRERDGRTETVDPSDVAVGETIVVRPGEKLPLDGVVLTGESSLDTAALTGESAPRTVAPGDEVLSGCVNLSGLLRVRVTKPFGESTVSKILELVESAGENKARSEDIITRFARWYTPAVVIGAALLAVIPPLFLGEPWSKWIHRALTFLVVSCPCALVISVPLSFFGGIGGASRQGVLVKGGNFLEAIAKAEIVVFDKTGTLTEGSFRVTETHPAGVSEKKLLELAALAESYSSHPIALSLREAWGGEMDAARVTNVEELSGRGVRARVDGRDVAVGNRRLMEYVGAVCEEPEAVGTVVHVAADGIYAGCVVIADEPKTDSAEALRQLRKQGVRRTVMLTGDAVGVAQAIGKRLGIDEVYAELLPADKVTAVEKLLTQKSRGGTLAFVGDGINDAPVLMRADVGVAMGALGSDAAIEAADIVLMDDRPTKLVTAIRIARKTLWIVRENIIFALGIKALVLVLGALGIAGMWEAVFADVGVSVIAILNAMRALRAR